MRVAVIGAGPSGLAVLKELKEVGVEAVCFEQSTSFGGVFQYKTEGNGVWLSCKLTSSATTTAFSDFPPRDTSPHHMLHGEYIDYLGSYVDSFDLRAHIHFDTEVTQLERLAGGRWSLQTKEQGRERHHIFDAIACCVGLHQRPYVPEEIIEFDGPVHHSATYKGAQEFRDKRVLVLGAGESGADIIKEIADVAGRCVLSLRRGVAVLTRMRNGYPTDYFTTRLFYSLPKWFARSKNPRKWVRSLRTITALLTLPVTIVLLPIIVAVENWSRWRLGTGATPAPVVRRIVKLLQESGGGVGDQFLTKSENFVHALVNGTCIQKGSITSISGREVAFVDGSTEMFDEIMCCTGYDAAVQLFPDVRLNELWKGCYSPDFGKTVSFIGLVRPAIGAIPPIAEMQARLFASICAGNILLPDRHIMTREIAKARESAEVSFGLNYERMPYLVDYTSYMDDIARTIGCEPVLSEMMGDPKLLYKFYCAHFMPAQYRLRGPGAKPECARNQIRTQIVVYPAIYLAFNLFYLLFSKVMFTLGARIYKPHLTVGLR